MSLDINRQGKTEVGLRKSSHDLLVQYVFFSCEKKEIQLGCNQYDKMQHTEPTSHIFFKKSRNFFQNTKTMQLRLQCTIYFKQQDISS